MLVERLWRQQPGKYFCISTKSASKKWKDNFFTRSEFRNIRKFLEDNRDKDIYFCPHGFTKPQRLKAFAVPPHLLYSDLDEADPRALPIRPSIAIQSSPGRFVGLWVTDKPVGEDLNRRLSYKLGADKSGWDLTQVLRFPNTTNYKYNATPRVKILWSDGDSYTVEQLEKLLPKEATHDGDIDESRSADLYKKNERIIPHWVRRNILMKKVPTGSDRSKVIFKMGAEMVEEGVTIEDTLIILWPTVWNKFYDRRDGVRILREGIEKVVNERLNRTGPDEEDETRHLTFLKMGTDVDLEVLDWLAYPYFAKGEVTILEGDPAVGKSFLMQTFAAKICAGLPLPSIRPPKTPIKGRVLYFDVENTARTVVKARLIDAGLTAVEDLDNFVQCEEQFTIDDEKIWEELERYAERVKPLLIVFDTLNHYLGKADAYKAHEASKALGKFRDLALRYNCPVVVLRHLTKGSKGSSAMYRGQGSIALTGVARIQITCGRLPTDPDTRAFAVSKMNLTKEPPAYTYRIVGLPNLPGRSDRARVDFGEFVDVSADELLSTPSNDDTKKAKAEAKEFLEVELENGRVAFNKLKVMAEKRSIDEASLKRAAEDLGVVKDVEGFGKDRTTYWKLG